MPAAGERVLITGISGFTGSYMAAELKQNGYEVFGTGTGTGSGAGDEDGYYQVDLNDAPAMCALLADLQPNIVLHLAALAYVGHGNADDFYRVNLLGTRQLLEAMAESHSPVRSVLLISSANVYGNAAEGALGEDTLPAPTNDYAVSKLAMEYMAGLWRDHLPLTIVRPFNYTGVGQAKNFLLPKIVDHFRRRTDCIELGNLDVWRDFNDVRTVVHLYRRLVEKPEAAGNIYNVSSGTAYSLREVISMCEELTGHTMKIKVNPSFVRSNEVRTLRGDSFRLRSLLGDWQQIELRDTLDWMLRNEVN